MVGQIGPFTGIPVPDALQLNQGIKACFAQINERGGIGGRRIAFFDVDDTYNADGFATAFTQAMQRKPVALLNPVGSAALKRTARRQDARPGRRDRAQRDPRRRGAAQPGPSELFHIRAGDRQQIEKIVAHVATLGVERARLCLHHNIVIGTSGLAMAQAAASASGKLKVMPFEATAEIPEHSRQRPRTWSSPARKAVLVVGAPRFMADGIAATALRAPAASSCSRCRTCPPGLLAKVAGASARGVALSQTYPNPMGVSRRCSASSRPR